MTTTDKLAAFDAAIAAELPRVYHLEYDSHEICKHFAGKVRERLLAAHDAEQAAKSVPADLRSAAERTRQDLGPTGSNYPDVRVLLAFVEQALAAHTPPAPDCED